MAYYLKKKSGAYELRMSFGKKLDGKPWIHTRTFHPPEGLTENQLAVALDEELAKFENDIRKGTVITGYSQFNQAAKFWLDNEAPSKLAPKTLERYREFARRIEPTSIGNSKIKDITPQDLNGFYRQLAQKGANVKTGEGLSPKTIREHHSFISRILELTWKWGCIPENPAKKADPPVVHSKPVDVLDEEELSKVMKMLKDEDIRLKTAINLLIICGMRKGELCGLEWKDIDFENLTMRIARSSQYVNHGIITKSTKTYRERTLSIDLYLSDLLIEYRGWLDFQRKLAGNLWTETDRLFVKADGTPIHPDTIGDWWDDFQKRIGIRHHTLHSLRHTNASMLISYDTDLATVSGRLGHKDATTTLKIYTHQFKARDTVAAQTLGNYAMSLLGEDG